MTLLENELKIIKINDLFDKNLKIPIYQRPYRWSSVATNTLFNDIYNAFRERQEEYRLGSVILHKKYDKYFIVDGQQRITTLSLLLYCLDVEEEKLLNENYGKLSFNSINSNYKLLNRNVEGLPLDDREAFKRYILNQCTVVQIVTDNEQEAFQFFDSQNSRGKELAPHDLLKSYHLREMNSEKESQKIELINRWENLNQEELSDLFRVYLYPLTQWYKGKSGVGYDSRKIDTFKGIKPENTANYAIYHKASNLFIEQLNNSGVNELTASKKLNQFLITQPVISGRSFFNYTLHYNELLEKTRKRIEQVINKDDLSPNKRSGDIYVKQLFESSSLFFADRFGIDSLTDIVIETLYTWSYSLRLVMQAVYPLTINKYATGKHERINEGIEIFSVISEMILPEEILLQDLDKPNNKSNSEKYNKIHEYIYDINGWRKDE